MATSADLTLPHPRTVSSSLHHLTVSTSAAEVLLSTTSASIQTSPVAVSLSDSFDGLEIDRSVASEIDRSVASNYSTTQSPPPQIALQPPTFQELPPLPVALQQTTSLEPECPESAMGAEANQNYAASSSTSKSENLRHSIGHLKLEMKNLRNADLTLLFQLNDLHQQIMSYKVAMSERQSETNSEYSNSFAEDCDFEDIEEDEDDIEEDEEERETRNGRMLLTNGGATATGDQAANGPVLQQFGPSLQQQFGPSLQQHGPSLLQPNGMSLHHQQHGPNSSLHQSPRPRNHQHSQLHASSAQSPLAQRSHQHHNQLPNNQSSTTSANSSNLPPPPPSAISRSSLQQLRQQLPPPPPRPAQDARQDARDGRHESGNARRGNEEGKDVDQWLDLNFRPDSHNC